MKKMLVAALAVLVMTAGAVAQGSVTGADNGVTTSAAPKGVNFQAVLQDQDGHAVQDCMKADKDNPQKCAEETPMTLARLALGALMAPEPGADGVEQMKRFMLAQRVYKATYPIELNDADRDLIKRQIAKRGTPWLTGQAFLLLDPATAK